MLYTPKNFKFKKTSKGKLKNIIVKNPFFKEKTLFGNIILIALESGKLFPNQVLNIKQLLNKRLKKKANIKICVFPQRPVSKKPLEIRMGKGKGSVHTWVTYIFSAMKLIEIETKHLKLAAKLLDQIQNRLSFKTKIIYE